MALIDSEQTKEYLLRACPMLSEDYLVAVLNSIPSERPKGKWNYLFNSNYGCSICGAWYQTTDNYGNPSDAPIKFKFCPNCGADMREEEDE